jgi:hypothetical protein
MLQTVESIIPKYGEKTAVIAWQLRDLLLKELKGIQEIADQSLAMIGYGYGTGYKDLICTIMVSKQGVKLGFYKATELPDPSGLLTGSGKVHKYVVIASEDEVKNPAIKKMILAALQAYKKRQKA